jgi:hypothetical protein
MRDFKRLQSDPPQGVSAAPLENNILKWHAVIFGYAQFLKKVCTNQNLDLKIHRGKEVSFLFNYIYNLFSKLITVVFVYY